MFYNGGANDHYIEKCFLIIQRYRFYLHHRFLREHVRIACITEVCTVWQSRKNFDRTGGIVVVKSAFCTVNMIICQELSKKKEAQTKEGNMIETSKVIKVCKGIEIKLVSRHLSQNQKSGFFTKDDSEIKK